MNKSVCLFAVLALLSMLLTQGSLFRSADTYVADMLYQRGNVSSGRLVLVELDEKTLERFGTTPAMWNRQIYADVLNILNCSSTCRPAVIALDVLFSYDKTAQEDQALAAAAAACGNVVTAEKLTYERRLTIAEDAYSSETVAAERIRPFAQMASVTTQGVVNPVLDSDGVIRHIRPYYIGPEGQKLPSFPLAIVRAYARETGMDLSIPEQNRFYLEYTYSPGGYRESVSLLDVYEGRVPPELFAGKIVLIGACAAAMQDDYPTAIDPAEHMYGVEVHANAVDYFLRGSWRREAPEGIQYLLLSAVLALCLWAFTRLDPLKMVLAWAGTTAASGVVCIGFFRLGYILHPLWIPGCAAILFAAALILRLSREIARRKKLRSQFGRYVDPQILEQILREDSADIAMQGKKQPVAVLFVDICGFTSLSERLEPEQVVTVLNRFLEEMTECVMQFHGTLDKFIGDCCMAFWNAPVKQEDAVMQAVRCAMEMIGRAETISNALGTPLDFAVGIHWGEAIVGNIGCAKRMDYTVIGDTVNTASRLESIKIPGVPRAGGIYISQEAASELRGRITAEPLGSYTVKGKTVPTEIYRVKDIWE